MAILTASRVRELLHYDDITGVVTRRTERHGVRNGGIGCRAGSSHSAGYREIGIDGRHYLEHRIIWLWKTGEFPKNEIDHINSNRSDNRWCNLRPATRLQQMANTPLRKDNIIRLKGVSRHHRGKWIARVRLKGKLVFRGTFHTPEAAHAAYCAVSSWHFGEYARSGAQP
jgi:hypothetical protein